MSGATCSCRRVGTRPLGCQNGRLPIVVGSDCGSPAAFRLGSLKAAFLSARPLGGTGRCVQERLRYGETP